MLLLPWSAEGGASALGLVLAGASGKWPAYAAAASLAPLIVAMLALIYAFAQGLAAGVRGPPFGIGALVALMALTVCLARALAALGLFRSDATIATIVVVTGALLIIFIFYPVGTSLVAAVLDSKG